MFILNFEQSTKLFNFLFKSQITNSPLNTTASISTEIQSNILITEKQRRDILYTTMWLFIAFLIVFLAIGIEYLSKAYYPNQNWSQLSDLALIELCLVIGGLTTAYTYSSFNLKSFIRGT